MNEDILKIYNSIATKGNQKNVMSQQQPNSAIFANYCKITSEAPKLASNNENDYQQLVSNEPKTPEHMLLLKRKREKCSKGLRHFSMKVCEKVKQKGTTSYNEVADELVNEYCSMATSSNASNSMQAELLLAASSNSAPNSIDYWSYDQKNVRRRVYDALNVLMAMNIISKEKKEIKWIGLPCNKKQECQDLEIEINKKQQNIKTKCEQLKELISEHIALQSLAARNKEAPIKTKTDTDDLIRNEKVPIPFVVLNSDKKTVIECCIASDKKEYIIHFDSAFEICSHSNLLKKLGFTFNTENSIKEDLVKQTSESLPKLFEPYIKQLGSSTNLHPICHNPNLPNYENFLLSDSKAVIRSSKLNSDLKNNSSNFVSNELDNDDGSGDEDDDQYSFEGDAMDCDSEENFFENDDEEESSLPDSLSP